ncbi:hypothetical protein KSP40_PGU006092 [Platanthera guangdongensis]|uniref:Uncharacterized protein n=1 Tax=Platanthera guangdongensis TaxID=2320717 RepID=A0ABR2LP34_9ASPA
MRVCIRRTSSSKRYLIGPIQRRQQIRCRAENQKLERHYQCINFSKNAYNYRLAQLGQVCNLIYINSVILGLL